MKNSKMGRVKGILAATVLTVAVATPVPALAEPGSGRCLWEINTRWGSWCVIRE